MTGPLFDRELADVRERERLPQRLRDLATVDALDTLEPPAADRTSPRWRRLRAACCEFTGGLDLDTHADRIWLSLSNTTGHGARTLDGLGAVPEGRSF